MALEGKFDPVLGRDDEIMDVIQVLSRRRKNNPCLVGEPGVGKTAIVEALAQKITQGEVPAALKTKRIYALDIAAMVAGTKYRGDFEERFKLVLDEALNNSDIIMFIDEIHMIMGAGAAEGGIDACGILKPILARGEIQLIGATTFDEFRKTIEKDAALERRFCKVVVEEPSKDLAVQILNGIKQKYEDFHNVQFEKSAMQTAVNLSVRYITEKFLPDKAIDLIDEACAKAHIKLLGNVDININKVLISSQDIADICAKKCGVPTRKIMSTQTQELCDINKRLCQSVVGQESVIDNVAGVLRRAGTGFAQQNKPLGSFLFLGPTGVGKTSLAKAMAKEFFANEKAIIRFDMSEYSEQHTVSRLIGAPPGYKGHGEGGQLTQAVRKKPYCVVLFDEIEKAHPDMCNILLQILDYGKLTDSDGRKADFSNTIVVLTSNIGAKQAVMQHTLGFGQSENIENEVQKNIMSLVKNEFKPELLSRLEEILIFKPLSINSLCKIANNMLLQLKQSAMLNNVQLKHTSSVPQVLAKLSIKNGMGARNLQNTISKLIVQQLADKIVNENYFEKNFLITTNEQKDKIVIKNIKQKAKEKQENMAVC